MPSRVPTSFSTIRRGNRERRRLAVRRGLDRAVAERIFFLVEETEWGALWDAYGPASELPAQLHAVALGDGETRDEAWWNLWGNVHHQGTIYEATVPAVRVFHELAAWRDYPDRVQALLMLREIAAAEGLVVWRYDDGGEIVHDRRRQHDLFADLRTALTAAARQLCARWRTEPEPVRRALVWLLSVVPEVRHSYRPLIDETLPAGHRRAWDAEIAGYPPSEAEADAVDALEAWVHGTSV
jgi:hypothetical protein